jgi:hypothetical protein
MGSFYGRIDRIERECQAVRRDGELSTIERGSTSRSPL